MKRLVIVLAVAAVVTSVAYSAQADAAISADPIKSLKRQFAAGRGVLVSETTKSTVVGVKGYFLTRTTGKIGFSKSEAVNYDLKSRYKPNPEFLKTLSEAELEDVGTPLHAIKVGRYTYVSGFNWGRMPDGVTWIRFGGKDNSGWGSEGQRGDQLVDVFNPEILKKVLAKATLVRPGEYRGTLVPKKDLYKGWELHDDVRKVSFRLFVNKDQVPVRLITEYSDRDRMPNSDGKLVNRTHREVVDTRYSGWGAKVEITAPPLDEVIDKIDLDHLNRGDQGGGW
ncbi:hypothetical protein [Streptosporangium vulgare]|uniref:Uncharacterized protein n=1 Tax=Streptosporangium vulgare TaxID=46190 RepID=A0ABV5TGY0_9ACTN